MRRLRALRHGQAGTAALETMVVMVFLFTLIFGFVHICLFVVTKSVANYAAFTEARARMVGGTTNLAARQVMSEVQWWGGGVAGNQVRTLVQTGQRGPRLPGGRQRTGIRVSYFLPFGAPLFPSGLGLVRAIGFSTAAAPHDGIPEQGDNK